MMKIGRGYNGGWYLVFHNEEDASKYHWLFHKILRMDICCYAGVYNAYAIIDRECKW